MEPGWKSPSSAICRSRVDLSSTKGGNGSGMGPPRLKVLHTLRFRPQKMKLRDPSLSCRALLFRWLVLPRKEERENEQWRHTILQQQGSSRPLYRAGSI